MARESLSIDVGGVCVKLKKHHLAKYIKLRVKKGGEAEVVAPTRTSFSAMASFAQSHAEWIVRTVARVREAGASCGSGVWLLGARFGVVFGDFRGVKFKAALLCVAKPQSFIFKDSFAVEVLANESAKNLNGVIIARDEAALKKLKQSIARAIFGYCFVRLKPLINGKVNAIRIKQMSTRWGSCNSRKGYINLSLELISRSFLQIEYVIVHELTHLNHPHHKPSFYSALALIVPDYKDKERLLKNKNL